MKARIKVDGIHRKTAHIAAKFFKTTVAALSTENKSRKLADARTIILEYLITEKRISKGEAAKIFKRSQSTGSRSTKRSATLSRFCPDFRHKRNDFLSYMQQEYLEALEKNKAIYQEQLNG